MKLHYGMKLRLEVNPISVIIPQMGIAFSSSDKTIKADFIVGKYWEDDEDANRYKVKLIPTDEFRQVCGNEKFYSSDLISMIERKSVEILN